MKNSYEQSYSLLNLTLCAIGLFMVWYLTRNWTVVGWAFIASLHFAKQVKEWITPEWEAVGVDSIIKAYSKSDTRVLYRNKYTGNLRSVILTGEWSLDQVRARGNE